MLLILENLMLFMLAIATFSMPVLLILPIIFAQDSYD